MHAVGLLQYLDDWLLRSPNRTLLAQQTSWLVDIIRRVGFLLNVEKSQLVPTQRLIHIGVEYHLDLGLMFPPMDRVHRFEGRISVLLNLRVSTAFFWLSLLGLLSSVTDVIPLGRLHLRLLQLYMLAHWAPASKNLKALIPVKHDLLDHHLRVARQKVYTGGHVAGHTRRPSEPVHGRFRVGVGSSPGRSPSEWTMVDEGDLAPHQSPGDAGRTECLVSLQGAVDRHDSTTHVRQRIRRLVPKETGRHGVCAALSPSAGSSSPGTRCTDHLAGQTHSGRKECHSRPSLQDEQSGSHRVDSTPIGGGFTVHHMGQAQCGPVCHPDEQQVTRVCIPHGRSIGVGCRRHVDLVERDVCVRISPVRDAWAGTREGTERSPMRDDLNRPQMAQSVLVRQTDGVAGRLSFGPSPEGRPADPTPQPPQTSVTSSSVPSRLEAVQRSLQERGFSQAAAEQISRGRRQSSRAVYDSKWRIFAGWCAEKSVDPFQVTIPQLADFFVYLFQVKRLNPRTIKGYRSAISSTISSHGSTTELST